METVGFLFKETKTHYVFAQSISDGSLASKDLYDDGIMIVKSNILKIKEIK